MLCGVANVAVLAIAVATTGADMEKLIFLSLVAVAPLVEETARWISAKRGNLVFFTVALAFIESALNFTSYYGLAWRIVPMAMHGTNAYVMHRTALRGKTAEAAGYASAVVIHALYNAIAYMSAG